MRGKMGMYHNNALIWNEFKKKLKREKKVDVDYIGCLLLKKPSLMGECHKMLFMIKSEFRSMLCGK